MCNSVATTPSMERRDAVISLTRRMCTTWNSGDADGYGELFDAASDYVAFDGTHLTGRHANVEHHRFLFGSVLQGSRLEFEGSPTIRFLSDDIAVMHAMGSVLMPWQSRVTPKRRSIQTYLVQRNADGNWRIQAFHNTRMRPLRLPSGIKLRAIVVAMRLRALASPTRTW